MYFSLVRNLALSAFVLLGALQAQVPQMLNYQGRIAVAGVNFDSTAAGHAGQFKFALVDGANPPVVYWSNDGTIDGQTTANAPTASVALPVAKGLYSVLLGDAALPNMTAIPASVFTSHADVRLRVWFDDGINGFQLLAPDQRIAAVGYAVMAASATVAQTVPDGAITAAKLADGAVSSIKLAPNIAINGTVPGALGLSLLGAVDAASARTTLGVSGGIEPTFTGSSTVTGSQPSTFLTEDAGGHSASISLTANPSDLTHRFLVVGNNLRATPSWGIEGIEAGPAWGFGLENNWTNPETGYTNHEFYLMDGVSNRPFAVNWQQPESGAVTGIVNGVATCTSAHGLFAGKLFQFSTLTGNTGLTTGTNYFVLTTPSPTTFTFSETHGGSASGGSATSGTWSRGGAGSAGFGVPVHIAVGDYSQARYETVTLGVTNTKPGAFSLLVVENTNGTASKRAILALGYGDGARLEYDPAGIGEDAVLFTTSQPGGTLFWKDAAHRIGIGISPNTGVALGAKATVGGQLAVFPGTAEAPTYTFHGDLDTGLYSLGNNQIGVAAGGTIAARFAWDLMELYGPGTTARFSPGYTGIQYANLAVTQPKLILTAGANLTGGAPSSGSLTVSVTGVTIGSGTEITSSGATGAALVAAASPASARTALGLGSLATQDSMTLKLVPQAAPANPVEGWIYADSTTHGLAYYNGTAWTQPYTSPAALLAALQGVGGAGSGLDADLVQGTAPGAFGLGFLEAADAGAGRTALGLGPVATVQGVPGTLGLTLLAAADVVAGRTALGLGSLATQDSTTLKLVPQAAPANPVEGWIYADSTTHGLAYYNGTAWTQPYTSPAALLVALQGVGGAGSGLDADLVHGTVPGAFGLGFLGATDAGAGRTALGLGPVATVQGAPGNLGLTLLGAADAVAGRTALGLGSLVTQSADAVAFTGGTIIGLSSFGVSTGPLLADSPVSLASTWNAVAVAFTALKIDVTDTASAAGSLLQDWQVGGMSKLGLRKDGTLLGPANTSELALEAGGFGRLSYAGLPVVSWNQSGGWMFASSVPMSWNSDLLLGRDGAAVLQLGLDAATEVPQTLKAHDGLGTDKAGADVTLAGGSGTGTGKGGAVRTATALSGATGGTQGALSTRTYQSAKPTALTDSAATTIASITLANGKHLGGRLFVTVAAEDATDFQVHSATLVFSAVNQGGAIVANISAESSATDAFTAGTLTTAWTIVQNGAAVEIKCNAGSSLAGAALTCKWIADLNSNDPAVVTPQ